MKKILTLLLVLSMTLALGACAQVEKLKNVELPPLPQVTPVPEETEPEPAPQETPAPTPEPEPSEEPAPTVDNSEAMRQCVMVNFAKTVRDEYDPAEGEQKILSFSCVTPHVTIPGREDAADAINEYIARLDESYYTGNDYGDGPSDGFNGMLEQALDNFSYVRETGAELPLEFSSSRDASVQRADGRVLSLFFNTSTYTGGAHGLYVGSAYVFDTETGELLTLDKLTDNYEAFSALVVQKMLEQAKNDEEMKTAISSFLNESEWPRNFARLLREGSWYLDDKGLVLFSTLYELAPYAAGIQSFSVSYEELGDLLDAKWRIGEKKGEGGFTFLSMSQVEEGSFPILDIVMIDDTGEQLCLKSDTCVYDVTLSRVGYVEELERFYTEETLWHCSCMQDAGVQLTLTLPESVPNVALSYRSGDGGIHRCLLTQSGEDGSLVLMDEGFTFYE